MWGIFLFELRGLGEKQNKIESMVKLGNVIFLLGLIEEALTATEQTAAEENPTDIEQPDTEDAPNEADAYEEEELLPEYEPAVDGPPPDFFSLLPSELSKKEKQILYLHIEAGLSHEEIAAQLGCKPEASRMRLYRARQRCKELLLKK